MKNYYEFTCRGTCALCEDRIYDLKVDDNIFIFDIDEENISVAAALDENEDISETMADFMCKAQLDCDGFEFEEMSEDEYLEHKNDYIHINRKEDNEWILPENLPLLIKALEPSDDDDEGHIYDFIMTLKPKLIPKSEAERLAAESDLSDDLSKEIERIYSEPKNSFVSGHPVHYYIETDTDAFADAQTLLNALYTNGRLSSKRCFYLPYIRCHRLNDKLDEHYLASLYQKSRGGAVIIDIGYENDAEAVKQLLSFSELNSQYTLTIFCGPRNRDKSKWLKKIIAENTKHIAVLPICENSFTGQRAEEFLLEKAVESWLKADDALLECAHNGKIYSKDELTLEFTKWSSTKLRKEIFTSYGFIDEERDKNVKPLFSVPSFDDIFGDDDIYDEEDGYEPFEED